VYIHCTAHYTYPAMTKTKLLYEVKLWL